MKVIRIFISNKGDLEYFVFNNSVYDTFVSKVTSLRWPVPHA